MAYEYRAPEPGVGRSPMGVCRECLDWPTRLEKNQELVDKYNTDIFANVQGEDVPVYNRIADVPRLPDGERAVLNEEALQVVENWKNGGWHARIHKIRGAAPRRRGMFAWWIPVVYLAVAIIGLASVTVIVNRLWRGFNAPCGPTGHEKKIDECRKLIVLPNCDGYTVNYCTGDCQQYTSKDACERAGCIWREKDQQCVSSGTIEERWKAAGKWIKYAVIGGIAIAGIWLVSKVVGAAGRGKEEE